MPRRLIPVVGLLGLALLLSACGGEQKREYAVPMEICGVPIPPERVEPFMPSGKKLTQRKEAPNSSLEECDLSVDGDEVFSVDLKWVDEEETVRERANEVGVEPEQWTRDETVFYSDMGAVALLECRRPTLEEALMAHAGVHGRGKADQAAMGDFIEAYRKAYADADACDF